MERGTVYNLATVKEWVKLKRRRFESHGNSDWQLYGYDVCRYGAEFDDALKVNDLFDVLETYAQAYFIYIMQSKAVCNGLFFGLFQRYGEEVGRGLRRLQGIRHRKGNGGGT